MTFLSIEAETRMGFDITFENISYRFALRGGEWQLSKDGGVIRSWQGRVKWFQAIARALEHLAALTAGDHSHG